jgi:hypothetical protein
MPFVPKKIFRDLMDGMPAYIKRIMKPSRKDAEIARLKEELRWKGECYDSLLANKGRLRARNGNLCRTITNFEGLITENARLEEELDGQRYDKEMAEKEVERLKFGMAAASMVRDQILAENDRLRAESLKRRWTGFITKGGTLHLHEDPDGLREAMDRYGRDWGTVAWIDAIELHPKKDS